MRPTPPAAVSSRTFTAGFLALLAAVILLAYANSFGVGFYFDDAYGIAQNTAIRSLRNVPRFFVDPFTFYPKRDQVDVRPLLVTSYALNYAVSGLAPWSYHLLNLLLHVAASVLVFFTVRDHLAWPVAERGPDGRGRLLAAGAALLFALAPLNTQPVTYVWARSALLATTLYLAAFHAHVRGSRAGTALLHALALLTKAIAITLPAVILVHGWLYRDRQRYPGPAAYLRDWRSHLQPAAIPIVLDASYLAYRWALIPTYAIANRELTGITPWTWFVSQWSGLLYYARLFVVPSGLSVDHDFPATRSLLEPRAWLSLGVLVLWLWAALRSSKRQPLPAFATLWFFVTLAPESSFAPLAEVVNDHRPYIASSLGLSVLLAWLLDRAARLLAARPERALAAAVGVLAAIWLPLDVRRNHQWGERVRLWIATAEASPGNGRAWLNAGQALMENGRWEEARTYLEKARALSPDFAYVYMNLCVLADHDGDTPAALRHAEQAVRLRPDLGQSYYYRGYALERLGRTAEAEAAYRTALEREPTSELYAQALAHLTGSAGETDRTMRAGLDALYGRQDPAAAVEAFRAVLAASPEHYGATFQLARALDAAGRTGEARPIWEKALAMAESLPDAATAGIARARLAGGPLPPSSSAPAPASSLPPPRPSASGSAGPSVPAAAGGPSDEDLMQAGLDALYARKRPAEAEPFFRRILARTPTHYGATYQLATSLDQAGRGAEARPLWEATLRLAESYDDRATATTARARLARRD